MDINIHRLISEEYKSPTFQDIIKYEHHGRRLQSEAFYLYYKRLKNWFLDLISGN